MAEQGTFLHGGRQFEYSQPRNFANTFGIIRTNVLIGYLLLQGNSRRRQICKPVSGTTLLGKHLSTTVISREARLREKEVRCLLPSAALRTPIDDVQDVRAPLLPNALSHFCRNEVHGVRQRRGFVSMRKLLRRHEELKRVPQRGHHQVRRGHVVPKVW